MPYVTLAADDQVPPLSIHFQTWGGRLAAPALVLLHELGGTLESLRSFGERIGADRPVIAFDQRGAGLSEKPPQPFTLVALAEDLRRLADALALPRPFHLMGLAMGAVTALQFAARHGDQLASLVLCDGTAEITDSTRHYLLDRAATVREAGMRAVVDRSLGNAFRGLPELAANPEWTAYRHRFLANSPAAYALHSEALGALRPEPADFARVRCRTLVLTGRHDFIWPPAIGADLASRLPRADFEVVETAAHFPPIQDPPRVAARVMQFLNQSDQHLPPTDKCSVSICPDEATTMQENS